MTTKVQKWGNSYAVRLPKAIVEEFSLESGVSIDFKTNHKEIVMKPRPKKGYSLEEMLEGVTPNMMEPLLDWGPDIGSEILPPWKITTRKKAK